VAFDVLARVAVERRPQARGHGPGLVEPLGRAQRDELGGPLGAEQGGEDALRVVVVVDEKDQVTQADQRVRAVARPGQRVDPAMDIADDMDPHGQILLRVAASVSCDTTRP
jgi:hypothetical protein